MREVLRRGYVVVIDEEGRPEVAHWKKIKEEDWGFSAKAIREKAIELNWRDEDIISSLEYGFRDWSNETMPVSVASPHQNKVNRHRPDFNKLVARETKRGWFKRPSLTPSTISFRIIPGNIEPKRTQGKFRLLWNLSWPALGTFASTITCGETTKPVAKNYCTQLPSFMLFSWPEIHTNKLVMFVLAGLARELKEPLLAWPLDFEDWFRQLAVSPEEYWKSQIMTTQGCRIDARMQMGRQSSAHHGQRLSMLLAEIVMAAADEEKWDEEGLDDVQKTTMERWKKTRLQLGPRQNRSIIIVPFQDDWTCYAIGRSVAGKARSRIREILERKYEVLISKKEEANRPPSTRFTSIGATYDTSNAENIKARPSDDVTAKLSEIIEKAKRAVGNLTKKQVVQEWAGLAQFIAGFVCDGRFLVNSLYSALAGSRHLRGVKAPQDMVRIGGEVYRDLDELKSRISSIQGPDLIDENYVVDGGAEGITTDATAPTREDGRGWGAVVGKLFARGSWSEKVCKAIEEGRINIYELELIVMVAGLSIAARDGESPTNRIRTVVRGDNTVSIAEFNRWRANGPAMRSALRSGYEVCKQWGVRVWRVHIAGEDNKHEDGLRRKEEYGERMTEQGYRRVDEPKEMREWIGCLLSTRDTKYQPTKN